MEILCILFKHKWKYYILEKRTKSFLRICKRCGKVQQYKKIFGCNEMGWSNLVGYTDKGAKKELWNIIKK
jgi:hypothetical protein